MDVRSSTHLTKYWEFYSGISCIYRFLPSCFWTSNLGSALFSTNPLCGFARMHRPPREIIGFWWDQQLRRGNPHEIHGRSSSKHSRAPWISRRISSAETNVKGFISKFHMWLILQVHSQIHIKCTYTPIQSNTHIILLYMININQS